MTEIQKTAIITATASTAIGGCTLLYWMAHKDSAATFLSNQKISANAALITAEKLDPNGFALTFKNTNANIAKLEAQFRNFNRLKPFSSLCFKLAGLAAVVAAADHFFDLKTLYKTITSKNAQF